MIYSIWFIVLGISLGSWQLAVWLIEIHRKREKYDKAQAYARQRAKPLLVCSGPWGNHRVRHLLNMPAHGNGDICLDIDRNAIDGYPNSVIADVTKIPFSDDSFGAVFTSHLLEHLSNIDEAKQALGELNRIAEAVFIASPSRQSIAAWLHPNHRLWVWQEGKTIHLKQRGSSENNDEEKYTVKGE